MTVKKPSRKVAKVPVVMQLEALECGAACLGMVLAYYEKWIPLEQVRTDCGVSRDGSNAKNIMSAARYYGLIAKGIRCEPENLKESGLFPCIIHWNFNHFVVLDGFRGNKAILNDPARGIVEVDMETFDESFTGICLMFEPGEAFKPEGKPKSMLGFVRERLSGTKSAVIFVLLTTLITTLIGIINPGLTKVFLDRLLTYENTEWLHTVLTLMLILATVQVMAEWISAICNLRIEYKMRAVGASSFMWKLLNLPMEFYSQRMAGDLLLRKNSNEDIANTLIDTIAPIALDTVMMVFYLVVMIRQSLVLAMIGVASIIINMAVSRYVTKKRVNITRVMSRDAGKLSSTEVSGIQMIETLKASGAEDGFFEKWSGYQASVNAQTVKMTKTDAFLGIIPSTVSALADILIQGIGIALIFQGHFTVGSIMMFQSYMTKFTGPAQTLISSSQMVQNMRTQMERLEDVLKYKSKEYVEKEAEEGKSYTKLSGKLEMKNISFGYAPLSPPLIENFDLSLEPGKKVAFVGGSGCGKSTLSKLISGLYDPWEGEILFDGVPINQIDKSIFTGSLAVVDQDIILFEDTIANNIKMWDDTIEDFEVILAARDAQIHDDIMQREGGYGYKITEGGKDFSGGQKQRLEIARVLAQDPTIVIMDEATSALDAKTEYNTVKAISDRGVTCIVIAHRLSTIRDCDEIIVLDKGKVVERGTHEELMAKNGMYVSLVSNE